jgi:hypothetical protein
MVKGALAIWQSNRTGGDPQTGCEAAVAGGRLGGTSRLPTARRGVGAGMDEGLWIEGLWIEG